MAAETGEQVKRIGPGDFVLVEAKTEGGGQLHAVGECRVVALSLETLFAAQTFPLLSKQIVAHFHGPHSSSVPAPEHSALERLRVESRKLLERARTRKEVHFRQASGPVDVHFVACKPPFSKKKIPVQNHQCALSLHDSPKTELTPSWVAGHSTTASRQRIWVFAQESRSGSLW